MLKKMEEFPGTMFLDWSSPDVQIRTTIVSIELSNQWLYHNPPVEAEDIHSHTLVEPHSLPPVHNECEGVDIPKVDDSEDEGCDRPHALLTQSVNKVPFSLFLNNQTIKLQCPKGFFLPIVQSLKKNRLMNLISDYSELRSLESRIISSNHNHSPIAYQIFNI
ncbi:hypothetical protein CROQUDRAFT_100301 [Cronartium quercuum f. sp. fusiforme G11]|uniref:Uncharacterized protein n=1 Tax=Cronartium quercuum f. sp. fusiforme G11 TaxID=708437 RepID=A0A9P6N6B8_9BASI|nr:hypothetical protein CROQUDRAFT_100301 [Cronartium quercuum f. sp. fusiforme G11]